MALRTLVIDDDPILARSIARMLSRGGFEVQIAIGAEAGLASFDTESTDLVLCDYRMPHMDGMAVLLEMRRRAPDVKVLLMTGNTDVDGESAEISVLLKPFDLDTVLAALS